MKTSMVMRKASLFFVRAVFAALAAILMLPSGPTRSAQAAPLANGVSDVVPFLGVAIGWSHRNRVYRDANGFIAERNEYYDALRDTARRQLAEREIGGLRRSQVAAYTKLVALIEQNRGAELAVAEARKREAREAFHRRIEGVLVQRILGTGAVQRLFGAMTRGVSSSQGFIDTAINKLSGGGGGILAEIERVRTAARDIENLAGLIGGPTGERLRRTANRVASGIERPQQMIKADLERVRAEIGELGSSIDVLARAGRTPSAGALAEGLVLRPPGGSDDPAVEAIAILLSRLAVGNGSLRDQAQAAIRAGFVARCTAIAASYRESLQRLQGETGNLSGAQSVAPCHAIDIDELIRTAQASGEGQETPEGVTEHSTQASPDEGPPLEERCSLSGSGDFVIENLQVTSSTSTCEDGAYPFGMAVDPLLAYLAVSGQWVEASDSPAGKSWVWQTSEDLQGAVVEATAQENGSTLDIDVAITAAPSGASLTPLPSHANTLALAALIPVFPLVLKFSSGKRRQWALLGLIVLSFLLMAQSCEVYGSMSGRYAFPIPEDGFVCEVPADDPNLAVMPESSGEASIQITIADEDGSVEDCATSASFSGLGVLKRDGVYTEEMFDEP